MEKNIYNELIKRRLASIEPDFQEEDWADFQNFRMAEMATPKRISYSHYVGYGLACLMLLTSLFFNAKHYFENTATTKDNSSVSETAIASRAFSKREQIKTITRVDTVYVEKVITEIQKEYVYPSQEELARGISELSDTPNSGSKNRLSLINNTKEQSGAKEMQEYADDHNLPFSERTGVKSTEGNVNNLLKRENRLFSVNALNILDKKSVSQLNDYSFEDPFDMLKIEGVNLPEKEQEHWVIKLPKLNFSNTRYRYGVMGDIATEQYSGGIINELLLNRKWGIQAGLRLTRAAVNDFLTEKTFISQTGSDFRKEYVTGVSAGSEIVNIRFDNYLLQLPLGITYRPVKRYGWSLLTYAGTDLNLGGKRYVTFDFTNDGSEHEEGKATTQFKSPVVSNVVLGLGLEKELGKFVFQARPYTSIYFKQLGYNPSILDFGLNFSLFYRPNRSQL